MSKLIDYITTHTGFAEDGSDVIFFKVKATNDATATELTAAIASHQGEFVDCNPLDGNEHNYLELGGWVGDQGLALRLMGLGAQVGLWDLLTPRTMMPGLLPDDLVQKMAGMGMISIQTSKP